MMAVFAKSNPLIKLEDHIHDCLIVFKKVIDWKANVINRLCEYCDISYNHFIRNAFLSVCFHDIGKATFSFQKKLKDEKHKQESHPLASVPIFFEVIKNESIKIVNGTKFYPELLAVASHHTKLHTNLFDNYDKYKPDYIEDYIKWYCNKVNDFASEFSIELNQPVGFSEAMIKELPYNIFNDVFGSIGRLNTIAKADNKLIGSLRDIFLIIKAILHYSDWLASGEKLNFEYSLVNGTEKVNNKMVEKTHKANWKAKFQDDSERANQHLFIQIPTGQGKTEASLLWATRFGEGRKIIYLLPTMVTTNKMWQRLCGYFGNDKVGLTHSTASYILHKQNEEMESQEIRKQLLYHKTFIHPVTVATVDQLLFSLFNWGHWVIANANSYNACIVIDEIHIYDAYTLGIILKMIEILKEWNTHFAVMSATFPDYLKKQLELILNSNIKLISDPIYDEMQRTKINTDYLENNIFIEDTIEKIKEKYEAGNKVLVICNTVDKSKEMYNKIDSFVPKENRVLYHSQFINRDKFTKEELLDEVTKKEFNKPFIAITTQIVEVSLDIDFDVMFTELAPIDAIVQRLGRVNRKGEKNIAEVFICTESEKSRKYVYNKRLLDLTKQLILDYSKKFDGNLVEKHYREIVNQIYREENFDDDFQKELTDGESLILNIWQDLTNIIYTLDVSDKNLHAKTRKEEYITTEVILQKDLPTINRLIEEKKYWQIQEWTLKVPYYRIKKFLIPEKIGDLLIAKCEYNSDIGIDYKDDDSNFA